MLIAVNGKRVGGMTQSGLEIELEISGPIISLVVSRYKYVSQVDERMRKAEQSYLNAVDQALNDERRLDWVDLGASSSNNQATSATDQRTPATVGGNRTADISDGARITPKQDEFAAATTGLEGSLASTVANGGGATESNFDCDIEPGSITWDSNGGRSNNIFGASLTLRSDSSDGSDEELSKQSLAEYPLGIFDGALEHEKPDGNAWLGCVCGVIHGKEVSVFWIQCDSCKSWYNVSVDCIGFDSKHAETLSSWSCWGCPAPDVDGESSSQENSSPSHRGIQACIRMVNEAAEENGEAISPAGTAGSTLAEDTFASRKKPVSHPEARLPEDIIVSEATLPGTSADRLDGDCYILPTKPPRKRADGTYACPSGWKPAGAKWDANRGRWAFAVPRCDNRRRKPTTLNRDEKGHNRLASSTTDSEPTPPAQEPRSNASNEVFEIGTLVFIREHAWPGVNNPAGIAKIKKSYLEAEGNRFYDVKYVVGGTKKGVEAEYVTRWEDGTEL